MLAFRLMILLEFLLTIVTPRKENLRMKNVQIEFRKEDFLEYRSLQAQLKFYEDQYKDLCIQMLKFEEQKDLCAEKKNTMNTICIAVCARSKAVTESILVEISEKLWIIRRTIDLSARVVGSAQQSSVAMAVLGGMTRVKISYKINYSTSQVDRYIVNFFKIPEVEKIFRESVELAKEKFCNLE